MIHPKLALPALVKPQSSPPLQASAHQEIAQALKDTVKYIMSEPKETGKATTPQATSDTDSKPAVRGSKLEVKDIHVDRKHSGTRY